MCSQCMRPLFGDITEDSDSKLYYRWLLYLDFQTVNLWSLPIWDTLYGNTGEPGISYPNKHMFLLSGF